MNAQGAGSMSKQSLAEPKNCSKSSMEKSILFLPAFLIGFAGYGVCALLAKTLFFSFHRAARESNEGQLHFSITLGTFFLMYIFNSQLCTAPSDY